jgi:CubicO group peptidase (beta-lactamase class C family)
MKYFPDYKGKINDNRKYEITLKHLLTMTGGIKPNERRNAFFEPTKILFN